MAQWLHGQGILVAEQDTDAEERHHDTSHQEPQRRLSGSEQGDARGKDRKPHNDVISGLTYGDDNKNIPKNVRTISFGFLPETAEVGEPTLFFVNDFYNPEVVVDIEWELENGKTFGGPVFPHVFEAPGRHIISVTLVDTGGFRTTAERVLWVKE